MVQTESNDLTVILVLNATTQATAAHYVLAFCPQFEGKRLTYKFTPICLAPNKLAVSVQVHPILSVSISLRDIMRKVVGVILDVHQPSAAPRVCASRRQK